MAAKKRKALFSGREVESLPQRDYYLDFIRAEEALKGVAERDHAVQEVLRTIRGRIDQQCSEVENFTREWGEELQRLKYATAAAVELVDLTKACELLKPATRGR